MKTIEHAFQGDTVHRRQTSYYSAVLPMLSKARSFRRFKVGRSLSRADISIEDPELSVSSLHAELSRHQDGRWFLTDCSVNGTYVFREGRWQLLEQGFIRPGERLSLGKRIVDAGWLIQEAQRLEAQHPYRARLALPTPRLGRYVRDPVTGEIRWQRLEE